MHFSFLHKKPDAPMFVLCKDKPERIFFGVRNSDETLSQPFIELLYPQETRPAMTTIAEEIVRLKRLPEIFLAGGEDMFYVAVIFRLHVIRPDFFQELALPGIPSEILQGIEESREKTQIIATGEFQLPGRRERRFLEYLKQSKPTHLALLEEVASEIVPAWDVTVPQVKRGFPTFDREQ